MKIIKPLSLVRINDCLLAGQEKDTQKKLTVCSDFSNDPEFIVKHAIDKRRGKVTVYEFYIFHKSRCVGVIEFERVDFLRKIFKIVNHSLLTPHSTIHPDYQNKNFSSFIYTLALKAGYTLISTKHSICAAKLWDSVAMRNGIKVIHKHPVIHQELSKQDRHTIKLLCLNQNS